MYTDNPVAVIGRQFSSATSIVCAESNSGLTTMTVDITYLARIIERGATWWPPIIRASDAAV